MIRAATRADVPAIHALIRELARYEKLEDQHVGTAEAIGEHLFGDRRYCEALVAEGSGASVGVGASAGVGVGVAVGVGVGVVGFALFFHNYSTFLARPGLYLEDLYVRPEARRCGHGRALLAGLARLAVERGCGRFEWSVLHWNEPAIRFYKALGAVPLDEWGLFRLTGDALNALARPGR